MIEHRCCRCMACRKSGVRGFQHFTLPHASFRVTPRLPTTFCASPGVVPMEPYPARCLCRLSDAEVIDCYTVRHVLLGGNPHASDIAGLPDAMPCNGPRSRHHSELPPPRQRRQSNSRLRQCHHWPRAPRLSTTQCGRRGGPLDAGEDDSCGCYSVVFPSKCSLSASASALVACTTPSRWFGGA